MLELILIRGLPGSGKTTVAKQFKRLGFKHLEADMYFTDTNGGYTYMPSQIGWAHQWCRENADEALSLGKSVVVANTFSRVWEMEPYFELAEKYKIKPLVIQCCGQFVSEHGVPEETIERMRARWEPYPPLPLSLSQKC